MKKLICLFLAIVVSLSLVACVGPSAGGSSDYDYELNVAIINSGLGTAYAEEIEKDFEAYYANCEVEPGSGLKGVDIKLHPGLDEYNSTKGTLLNTIDNLVPTVYILDRIDYQKFVIEDKLVDISDVVTDKIYDKDGNFAKDTGLTAMYSIEDLMADGYSEFYRYQDGNCYGIPYRASIGGLIYDADLFDTEGYFFKSNGQLGAKYADIKSGNCSTGPDGVLGTSDDGLPNTMSDFATLISYMRNRGTTPFSFSGAYKYTRNEAYQAMHANYEGKDNFLLNYTFNGYDTGLKKQITEDNYTDLLDQEGRRAAIRIFEEIAKNDKNWVEGSTTSLDQKQAQNAFIMSVDSNNPVAFLFEGGWWESEARLTFENMQYDNEDWGYGKRNIRLFPYPNMVGEESVKDQVNTVRTLVGQHPLEGCSIFLSKNNSSEIETIIGKEFLRFMNRRDQIIDFTKNTGGCIRCIEIPTPYTEAELSTLTKYGKSIFEFINEGADIVFTCSVAKKRIDNPTGFGSGDGGWGYIGTPAGGVSYNDPLTVFLEAKKTVASLNGKLPTVDQVFQWSKAEQLRLYGDF